MPFGPRSLLDPRMTAQLEELWSSRCTIQLGNTFNQGSGQTYIGGYGSILTLTNIPCRLAPIQPENLTSKETRTTVTIDQDNRWEAKLNGYYAQIVPRTHRALIDGVGYLIRGVEHDSERYSTRLSLEQILPVVPV